MKIQKPEKKVKPKEYTLTQDEYAQYVFIAQQLRAKELEFNHWGDELNNHRLKIVERCGIDIKENIVDFDKVFASGGRIFVTKPQKPQIKVSDDKLQVQPK